MTDEASPVPPKAPPRLTPLKRLGWTALLIGGGFGSIAKFLMIAADHEKWYEDFFGHRERLPQYVQAAISWQRFVSFNILYFGLFVLVPLVVWIWLSRRPATVRLVVITLVCVCFVQGLVSILATLTYMPVVLKEMSPR